MKHFSPERRARWVMFLGLWLLAGFYIFRNQIAQALDYESWLQEGGWLYAFAVALVLIGAWSWCNAREDANGE